MTGSKSLRVRLHLTPKPHLDMFALGGSVVLVTLVGTCPRFLAEVGKNPLVARCQVGVLISCETGTGKELVARAAVQVRSLSS